MDMDFEDIIPHDGDVYALSNGTNPTRAEFVDTNGRIAWRLYDRHGRGVLLTEQEIKLLIKLSTNALNTEEG